MPEPDSCDAAVLQGMIVARIVMDVVIFRCVAYLARSLLVSSQMKNSTKVGDDILRLRFRSRASHSSLLQERQQYRQGQPRAASSDGDDGGDGVDWTGVLGLRQQRATNARRRRGSLAELQLQIDRPEQRGVSCCYCDWRRGAVFPMCLTALFYLVCGCDDGGNQPHIREGQPSYCWPCAILKPFSLMTHTNTLPIFGHIEVFFFLITLGKSLVASTPAAAEQSMPLPPLEPFHI